MISGPQAFKLFISSIAIGVLAILLTACDGFPIEDFSKVPETRQPQVNIVQHRHIVAFAGTSDRLTPEQREQLDRFLGRVEVMPGDIVHVVNGIEKPSSANDAAARALRATRIGIVKSYLGYKRVPVQPVQSEFGIVPVPPDQVQVVVRRYALTLPGCPDWSKRPDYDYYNHTSSNFGCATASNLGLMVANPGDLVAGRKLEPADPYYNTFLMERYRRGDKVPLPINGESLGRETKQGGGGQGGGGGNGGDQGGGEGGGLPGLGGGAK